MAFPSSSPVDTDTHQAGDGVEISFQQARQAVRPGKRVLMMLLASIALVVIAFLIAYAASSPGSHAHSGGHVTAPAATAFNAPEPVPKQPS